MSARKQAPKQATTSAAKQTAKQATTSAAKQATTSAAAPAAKQAAAPAPTSAAAPTPKQAAAPTPIAIGANIYHLRKQARLTQDDLATFLGVTKASVSKWETGQSYPDIELLPRIATYFDTTLDRLVGYEPQLSTEAIRRECARLRAEFASGPFEQAHASCQALVRDYYSCYPLLAQVASLYLNHANLVDGPARDALMHEAIDLCHRVRSNSESSADIKYAEGVEAAFYLLSGNPQAVTETLGQTPEADLGTDMLLARAQYALGQVDEADRTLQAALMQSVILSLTRLSEMAPLYADDPAKLDAAHDRAQALIDAFDLNTLYLNSVAVHYSFAMAYLASGNTQRCLDCLEDVERACRALEFPLKLHGDAFFDKVESWIDEVNVIGTSAPRDEELAKQSLLAGVVGNPAFAVLGDDPRFKRIVKGIEEALR